MLQAGLEGTATQFFRCHQTAVVSAVLSVMGIATGTAAVLALMQALAFTNAALLGGSAALVLVVVYGLGRQWGLAALTALAPLPGLIWAAPIASGSDFAAVPFLAYGLSVAAAILISEHKLARLLQADVVQPQASVSRWGAGSLLAVVAVIGLTAVLALLWFHGGPSADAALQAVTDSGLAALSVALLLPLGFSLLHFDEAFVARANRAREQRGRWLEGLSFAAVPRWGLSLTGVTAVLIVLGWYGARGVALDVLWIGGVSLVLIAGLGGLIGAGWREGLAFAAAITAACLLTLWATTLTIGLPDAPVVILQTVALALLLSLDAVGRARRVRQQHKTARAARARVLTECGGSLFAMIANAAAILPLIASRPITAVALMGVGLAGLSGMLLSTAVASGLEACFPRRATVEELYSHRPHKR